MDNFSVIFPYITIIILLLIGIIILITVIITSKKVKKSESALDEEIFRKEVNLINEKLLEMNDYYKFMTEQMDKKQKELLFLYQMISLKEEEIKKIGVDETSVEVEELKDYEEQINEFNKAVVALYKEGLTEEEIAKKLKKGKGEVRLAIKLYC